MKMIKIVVLSVLCALSAICMSQESFGPYLTYPGKASNGTERMTIQIGRPAADTKAYYVAYWKDGGSIQVSKMDTRKIVNDKAGEYSTGDPFFDANDKKYAIISATLTGLSPGCKYHYFVSESLGGYTYSAKSAVTAADFAVANGKLLVKSSALSGSYSGAVGSVAFTDKLALTPGTVFNTGSTCSISTLPNSYTFMSPSSNANTLTCFVTSDTQKYLEDGRHYFQNMFTWVDSASMPNMIVHAGDMHSDLSAFIGHNIIPHTILNAEPIIFPSGKQVKRTALFSSFPLQVAEGNHDLGYYDKYSADGIVSTDAQIDYDNKKYTREMIWFDKVMHYDYPGLKTTVKVMSGGTAKDIKDEYSSYYSFDNGPVHFCMLDHDNLYRCMNTKDTGYVAKQLRWLAKDLAATTKPFKVIVVHEYTGTSHYLTFNDGVVFKDNTRRSSREVLDSIMYKYNVMAAVSGHYSMGVFDAAGVYSKGNDSVYYDYIELNDLKRPKKVLWFDIGDVSCGYDAYYTFTFNASPSGNTFYYTRYNANNVGTKSKEYILDNITNVAEK